MPALPPPSGPGSTSRARRRRYAQNFLVDRGAAARIVEALAPERSELVLEIGPGEGALTRHLVRRSERVAAVELDPALVSALRLQFKDAVRLYEADALATDLRSVIASLGGDDRDRLVVAANLPYNISKPFALKLVRESAAVQRAVLTFQREVADRLTARHATRAYGPMTVLAGMVFRIDRLFDLPPRAFRPRPKVSSSVTRWRIRPDAPLADKDLTALERCLRAAFARRRQTLLNNLRAALAGGERQARRVLSAARLDGRLRAEAVAPDGFARLASVWSEEGL